MKPLKLVLLFLLAAGIWACKRDDKDASCETFFNTKPEIVIVEKYNNGNWQDYELDDTILSGNNIIPTYLTRRSYDEYRWIVNKDSHYVYSKPYFGLGFPKGKFEIMCIGKKYLKRNTCGSNEVQIDTIKRTIISMGPFSYLWGTFQGISTETGNQIVTYRLENCPNPSSLFTSCIIDFGKKLQGKGWFKSTLTSYNFDSTSYDTDPGVTYAPAATWAIRPEEFMSGYLDTFVYLRTNIKYNTQSKKVNADYYYDTIFNVSPTRSNRYQHRSDIYTFTGKKIGK